MTRFDRARLAALMHDLVSFLTRRPADLLPFSEVRERLNLRRMVDRGTSDVPLAQIVGTLDRAGEFNRAFLPRDESLRERWEDVRDLAEGSAGFPSVELYRVGDAYFVVDGHHRVSVARSLGAPTIEAHVREFLTPLPLDADTSLEDVVLKEQLADFLDATSLVPHDAEELRVTVPDGYARLLEHVSGHRYYRGLELSREVPWPEAAESWYGNVFRPMVATIRQSGVLEEFPGRTEADLYLFTTDHLHHLRQLYGTAAVPAPLAVSDFALKSQRERKEKKARRGRGAPPAPPDADPGGEGGEPAPG